MSRLARIFGGWRRSAPLLLLCVVAGMVQAQSTPDEGDANPPDRVARLSYLAGDVGLRAAGTRDWRDASINRPLTTGDRLSSSRGARAELQLGGGILRIAGGTDFGVLNLNDQLAQVELTQGTLILEVRRLGQGQSYEIDTPTVALVVDEPGRYRIDLGNGSQGSQGSQVTVFDGSAVVYGQNQAQRRVNPGRSYLFSDASLANVDVSDLGRGDNFDDWSDSRDRLYSRSVSRQYVSDDVVGYQDLDQYGAWQSSGEYGAVWYPTDVDTDWAPYRDGHWAYIAPWGWTWVDNLPWGFAPYHYGRWAYTPRGWGWIPGPRYVQPIYAPALVAFVGGGGWSVGIGGPVGWFPLGPGEIYNPWYACNRSYYQSVNVTNIHITNIYNQTTIINRIDNHYRDYRDNRALPDEHYVNRLAPRGFTAVSGRAFADGRPVQRDLLHVDARQLANTRVLARGSQLQPLPQAPSPSRSAHVKQLPVNGFEREVVALHAPPLRALEPHAGPHNNLLQPVVLSQSGTRVRVLDPHPGQPAGDARPLPSPQREGHLPPYSNVIPQSPVLRREDASTQPLRTNELPSARFAHPASELAYPPREANRPAPGSERTTPPPVGYNNPDNPRMAHALPQVPQIQRATSIVAPTAQDNHRMPSRSGPERESPAYQPSAATQPALQQPQYRPEPRPMAEPQYRPEARPMPQPQYRPEPRPMPQPQPQYQPEPRPMPQPQYRPEPRPMAPPPRQQVQRPAAEPHPRKQDENGGH